MNTYEYATQYIEKGFSIIPIHPKGKEPMVKWETYQTKNPTTQQVKDWFTKWPEANIGIITGKLSDIDVIDIDSEEALVLAKAKGLPRGPMVKTSRGYHLYCRHKDGLRNFQKRDDLPGIDLRAEGGCAVAPPSVHESGHVYQWVDDCELEAVELPETPNWIIAKTEFDKIPITGLLKGVPQGSRNNALARLAGHWAYKNLKLEQCINEARQWNKQNRPPMKDDELEKTVKSIFTLHHRHKASESSETSIQSDNTENSEVYGTQYSAHFDGLIDIVERDGIPMFLVKDKDNLTVVNEWRMDNRRLLPPPKKALTWLLPRAEEVLNYYKNDNDKKLYDDLYQYHRNISELPSEGYYDLLVLWDFHTYLLEHFPYTPYLYLFAIAERGKSRTGKGISYVSYRGHRTEIVNDPQIIRLSSDYRATLFLDMMNLWDVARRNKIQDVLLGRFEKGSSIARVRNPEKGKFEDMVFYDVFGPTIMATNVKVHHILETRAIEINMPESDREFEDDVTPEQALPLKERLVAFRARHINAKIPNAKKPAKGRLGDIILPIYQTLLLVNPKKKDEFLDFVVELDMDRKVERSLSTDAEILIAIEAIKSSIHKGKLSVKDICEQLNQSKSEKFKISDYSVGRSLTAMGFKRGRMNNGSAAIRLDETILDKLLKRYGISGPSSETSETSDSIRQATDETEASETKKKE